VTARQVEDAFAEWGEWKAMAYWFREWNHRSTDKENKDAESAA